MKNFIPLFGNRHLFLFGLACCWLFSILIISCSNESLVTSENGCDDEFGSIAFNIKVAENVEPESFDSIEKFIVAVIDDSSQVRINVLDSGGNLLASGGPFSWSAKRGTVNNIPPGANRKVVVKVYDSSGANLLYQGGTQNNITVTAGNTTNLTGFPIVVYTPDTRVIRTSPASSETDWNLSAPVNATISVLFTAAIDKSTVVYGTSFIVYEGDESGNIDNMVVGEISFSSDNTVLYFKPSNLLDYSTVYGISVYPTIKDLSGSAVQAYIGAFGTEDSGSSDTTCVNFSGRFNVVEVATDNGLCGGGSEPSDPFMFTITQSGCHVEVTDGTNIFEGYVEGTVLNMNNVEFPVSDEITANYTGWTFTIDGSYLSGYSSWTLTDNWTGNYCTGTSVFYSE